MLDIFINEFLNSLETLLRSGLRSKYVSVTENSKYLCGKLDYTRHIKYNAIRKDRFYITHDVFTLNNPENRLIKSTLMLLKKVLPYQFKIQKMLSLFSSVELSKDYLKDFKSSNIPQYMDCIKWCKVFLLGNGFTPFAGDTLTYALLFPMEKVFEDYVAKLVKKSAIGYTVSIQSRGQYLVDKPYKAFALIPDIVLSNVHETIILDTKWKLLNVHSKNYGISQQDMYQMFAYAKKYHSHRVILIYPLMENSLTSKEVSLSIDDITIEIKFIKL
jgi:5-methylcytosine-specific restriction enzyme subunit McrC